MSGLSLKHVGIIGYGTVGQALTSIFIQKNTN